MTVETMPRYLAGFRRARYVLNGVAVVLLTVVLGIVGLVASIFDPGGRLTLSMARIWARGLLRVAGIQVQASGLGALDPDGAYVFVANHSSALDIPTLLVGLPDHQLRMLAKESLFSIPFLGWYIRRVGYIPVDRSNPRDARRVLTQALTQTGTGASIVVFPEGTRFPEGRVGEFKRGAVFLAREAKLPIVPVALVNTGNLLPRGELRADPGVVEVRLGEPFEPAAGEPTRALATTMRDRVLALLERDRLR